MLKLLNGAELAGYIKERQARQVRSLRQSKSVIPKLAIIKSQSASPVIDTYVRMKQIYAKDILIETEVLELDEADMPGVIEGLNSDDKTHGIIVQLPLRDSGLTDEIVNLVAHQKDVDGLGKEADFTSATAEAIDWLLVGYSVDLKDKNIVIVGNGRLVGSPLAKLWQSNGLDVTVLDEYSKNVAGTLADADVIVSATGVPRLITTDMVKAGAVVVDAGTTSENGVIIGDVDSGVYERNDIAITPVKGGVGPLTIAALFDHVVTAARLSVS